MNKKTMYAIVGCGNLGAHLAKALSDRGCEVLIIDREKKSFEKLGQSFGGLTAVGDATDLNFLSELSLENAKFLVAVTQDDNINFMVCQIAKELYKTEVVARLYDAERESVYKEFGVQTICPEELTATSLEKSLMEEQK